MIQCWWNERRARVFTAVVEAAGDGQPPFATWRYIEPSEYPRATCPVYVSLSYLCGLMAQAIKDAA